MKKQKRARLIAVLTLILILLLIICGTFWIIYRIEQGKMDQWRESRSGNKRTADESEEVLETSAFPEGTYYTQEEVDARIAEAIAWEQMQVSEAAQEKEKEILGAIRSSLEDGNTVVETLRPFYPDKLVLVSDGIFHFVQISETLVHNDYTVENLNTLDSGELQYLENGQVISHKGIDVSKFQGDIDWEKVAQDGVEFAFIRAVIRGYGSEGKLMEDEYFEQNIEGATKAGIKVGVYVFSQAISEEEMLDEVNLVLEKVAPYEISCPIVLDVEKIAGANGRMNNLTVEERTNLAILFCQRIETAGYRPMIYHNMEMGILMLDLEQLEEYDKWFAYYNSDLYYPYEYKVWQYTEKGKVDGIGTNVDMNISFVPLWQ